MGTYSASVDEPKHKGGHLCSEYDQDDKEELNAHSKHHEWEKRPKLHNPVTQITRTLDLRFLKGWAINRFNFNFCF